MDELFPVALALNINTNQKDLAVKHALIKYAKSNADDFLGSTVPWLTLVLLLLNPLTFQVIEERGGAVVWFDTGKMIFSVPVGQSADAEVMTRFVMTDKGSTVLTELERQLEAIARHQRIHRGRGAKSPLLFSVYLPEIPLNPWRVREVYNALKDIANKDQRGFVTPAQFNAFAPIAQSNIFNRLFTKLSNIVALRRRVLTPAETSL